jgi:glycosyltransferase involved in cell wall biosynthesis
MKVLWITSAFPDVQGTGGMVHEFELLRAVAPRNEITLITTFWMISPEALRAVEDLGVTVEVVPWPWEDAYVRRSRVYKLARLLAGAAPNFEMWSRRKRFKPLADAVGRAQRAQAFDLTFVIQGELAPILDAVEGPTALLLYDIYSRVSALVSNRLSSRSIRYRLEQRNAGPWERARYKRADAIAAVSPLDAEIASRMAGKPVETIPNPVPDDFFDEPSVTRSDTSVTIIGSFGWEPNIDSVQWMCAEIWPQVRAARPDAKLRVVGRFGSPELRRTVEEAGGEYCGEVDDIRPYYWEAAVIVANIRMGSGMRNKVLHAMACGAPLVATPSAMEGIDPRAREHLLVAEDAASIARAIIEALNDRGAALERARASKHIAAGYSSASAGAALERWWGTVAMHHADAPGPPEQATLPSVSVVVCTKDRPDLLKKTLARVAEAVSNVPGTEVIVVEQGARHAEEVCAELRLQATVISDDGFGVSRARNLGTRAARRDLVLFTDDDCEVPPDWVRAHADALRRLGVIASFGATRGVRYDERYDPVALPALHRSDSPPWMVGHASNVAVRRSVLLAIGGFDERIGPGSGGPAAGEDADLIVRLLREGPVVTGTGAPLMHMDEGWAADVHAKLLGYEVGAGAWIGKAFREQPRAALTFLRARIRLQGATLAHAKANGDESLSRGAFAGALGRGMIAGVKMKPWKGEQAGR